MLKQLRKMLIPAFILTLVGVCIYYFFLFSPELTWDPSPKTLVVYTSFDVRHIDYSYIPDFRLWGDGHVIWVKYFADGKRKVFEGNLSEKEMVHILEKLKDAGFLKPHAPFERDREEDPYCRYQGGQDGIFYVDLLHHSYWEKVWTKDKKVCDVINDLVTGTELVGREYIPTEGKLYVVPIEKTGYPLDTKAVYQWSDADFSFRPEIIVSSDQSGMVIRGQEIQHAWDIVNRSSVPIVVSNGKKFWMAVSVKEISTIYE